MRAQLLTAFGKPTNFQFTEVPDPTVSEQQVLIRVAAIGLNSLETKIRNGWLQAHFPTPLPAILGKEISGTVVRIGEAVTGLAVGDRVAGFARTGAYAELTVARPEALARVPAALTFEQAASLPVAVETATRSLELLRATHGDTVVVNGATGTVGSAAVQLLVQRGVRVIGTASPVNHAYLASLGAIPVAYGDGVAERIRAAACNAAIAGVFDVAGHGFAAIGVGLTGDAKRVVSIADFSAAALGIQISVGQPRPVAESFVPILPLAAAGTFKTHIDRVFPFSEIAAAHELVEQGHVRGKVVVRI